MYHLRPTFVDVISVKSIVVQYYLKVMLRACLSPIPILPLSWGTSYPYRGSEEASPFRPFPTFRSVSLFFLPIILPEISSYLPTQHTRARGGRKRKGKAEKGGRTRRRAKRGEGGRRRGCKEGAVQAPASLFFCRLPPQEQGGEGNDGTQKRRNARAKCKGERGRKVCLWSFGGLTTSTDWIGV